MSAQPHSVVSTKQSGRRQWGVSRTCLDKKRPDRWIVGDRNRELLVALVGSVGASPAADPPPDGPVFRFRPLPRGAFPNLDAASIARSFWRREVTVTADASMDLGNHGFCKEHFQVLSFYTT
jgi:hypothetical protein